MDFDVLFVCKAVYSDVNMGINELVGPLDRGAMLPVSSSQAINLSFGVKALKGSTSFQNLLLH